MKVVIFCGGMGNQLFLYSFYEYLRNNVDKNLYACFLDSSEHNGLEVNRYFETDIRFSTIMYFIYWILNSLRYRLKSQILAELFVDEEKYTGKYPFFYRGVWQDKKYLNDHICFKPLSLSDRNATVKRMLLATNSVAIHIRRGDYLSDKNKMIYWNLTDTSYYEQAISYVKTKLDNCSFFIFSNDMTWVKAHLPIEDACYVDWNEGKDSVYDMYLMSLAKANIIANSTFSFWGGYLNKRAELCIYPLKWYKEESGNTNPDIFPENWIGL